VYIINSILYNLHEPVLHPVGENNFYNFQRLLCYNFCYRTITPQSIELALVGLSTKEGFAKKDHVGQQDI